MRQIVTADIGGTHARFAIARLHESGAIELADPVILKTNEHASFETAWEEFGRRVGQAPSTGLAIAFAGPVGGELLKLTNSPWVIRPELLRERLGIGRLKVVNDFGAVAHAVASFGEQDFRHICGPDRPLPSAGVVTIVGPGTGLGVAALLRHAGGGYEVLETEGGHIDFAPLDPLEDKILARLRDSFRRVSVERIVSGRGLLNIYEALAAIEHRSAAVHEEKALWAAALDGSDALAAAALERLCLSLGSVTGDLALAHGANAVVLGGGVGLRVADRLPRSGFGDRFIAKGRFERRMADIPVKLIVHQEPGLFGAAAAFACEHR